MNGVYGRAATGLQDSSWAVNETVARIGAKGEQKTEALLNGFALKAAVLHDLRVPLPGFKANIDHVIVSGKNVLILDTKVWKPGFYSSVFGYRRGWAKADHVGKDQSYVSRSMDSFLAGTGARIGLPRLVVWSSRDGQSLSTWALKVPGASIVHGLGVVPLVKAFVRQGPADPAIVARLRQLLVTSPRPGRGTAPANVGGDDPFGGPPRPPRVNPHRGPDPFA
ncbi:nuclease-related domain-containing protein (plasmid) [Pseudarthrobacter sp. P1]|uniref:nuclease-related domain-containing protein n=1 Tax=Pseudarthrobacter sp. P1 TaxID=3418418 RepID=UPI003CE99612